MRFFLPGSVLILWLISVDLSNAMVDLTIEDVQRIYITDVSGNISNIKVKKKRSSQCFVGPFELFYEHNNDLEVEVLVYKLQGNEFRLTPFKYKRTKLCDGVNSDPYISKQLYEHCTLPKGCPVPAGNYEINWCPDLSQIPPNFTGKFKLETNVYHNDILTSKIIFIGTMERYAMS